MLQEKKRQPFIIRLMIVIFLFSVAGTVIPSNTISVFGFLGEMTVVIDQLENVEIIEECPEFNVDHAAFGNPLQKYGMIEFLSSDFEWLLILLLLWIETYILFSYTLPDSWNLINYKVRLDD